MANNAVTDWSPVADSNGEIAGINIAEGCPAGSINNAIRTVMGQIAVWLAAAAGPLLKTGGAVTGAITGMLTGSTVLDGAGVARFLGYRNIPFTAPTTGRTLALTDVGMCVPTTGAINVPLNSAVAFAIGDTVEIYNNSGSSISITATGGVTLRLGGSATTGTRALAQRGSVFLQKVATDEWVAMNGGVS